MGRSALPRRLRFVLTLSAGAFSVLALAFAAAADTTPSGLPFSQDWTNTSLITANDDWSGVSGVVGSLGQDITTSTGVDPQTLLTESALANEAKSCGNCGSRSGRGST